jgi:hypothetical protein
MKVNGEVYGIGVASIYIDVERFIESYSYEEIIKVMQAMMKELKLGLFMLLTKYELVPKEFTKEFVLYADTEILGDADSKIAEIKAAFEADKEHDLGPVKDHFGGDAEMSTHARLYSWTLGNHTKDRKTLDKFLKKFFK